MCMHIQLGTKSIEMLEDTNALEEMNDSYPSCAELMVYHRWSTRWGGEGVGLSGGCSPLTWVCKVPIFVQTPSHIGQLIILILITILLFMMTKIVSEIVQKLIN